METNERRNKRNELKRKKDKRNRIIIIVVLAALLVGFIVMKAFEIDFASLKGAIVSDSAQAESYPRNLDGDSNAKLLTVNDKLVAITSNSVDVITPSNANVDYTFAHGYSNPIYKTRGNYICTYDQGGTRIRLDSTKNEKYEKTLEKNIICANTSQNGYVCFVTFGDDSKSFLTISNKASKDVYSIDIDEGYVVNCAINSDASVCAYVVVNSSNSVLKTTLQIIDTKSDKKLSSFDLTGINIKELYYSNNSLYVIGDNYLGVVKSNKKLVDVLEKDKSFVLNYAYTSSGELVVNYSLYENSIESTIAYISTRGKIKNSYDVKKEIESISSNSNLITVLYADEIVEYSLGRNKIKNTIKCNNSINNVQALGSKIYGIDGQCLDVIE